MIRFLAMGLAAIFIMTACGYKGPLVMPDAATAEEESAEKSKKQKTP